jgi:hypothetical protein
MKNLLCVQHKSGWCLVKNNLKPIDPDCVDTQCGCFVVMPLGLARRVPTCKECRKTMWKKIEEEKE